MSRIAYVNGRYVALAEAAVHVEDRGYQFADGVYEVIGMRGGRLIDEDLHLERLDRSLGEVQLARPMDRRALRLVMREVIRRNRARDGVVYIQVSRGSAPRDHKFPAASEPALVITLRLARPPDPRLVERGASVIIIPDIRWRRCDIKSVSLLPNVLGKQQAVEAGAYEAWQVDDNGDVTEGTSTNAWIVTAENALVTRDAGRAILNGVTRLTVLRIAEEEGVAFHERPFSVAEAKAAREAFVTSTSSLVLPVVRIDGAPVGDGEPGPLTRRLCRLYDDHLQGGEAATQA